jgi:hypothetical protein
MAKEKTYCRQVIAEATGLTVNTIMYRAKRLKIRTNHSGFTAKQVTQIRDYAPTVKERAVHTAAELLAELENI